MGPARQRASPLMERVPVVARRKGMEAADLWLATTEALETRTVRTTQRRTDPPRPVGPHGNTRRHVIECSLCFRTATTLLTPGPRGGIGQVPKIIRVVRAATGEEVLSTTPSALRAAEATPFLTPWQRGLERPPHRAPIPLTVSGRMLKSHMYCSKRITNTMIMAGGRLLGAEDLILMDNPNEEVTTVAYVIPQTREAVKTTPDVPLCEICDKEVIGGYDTAERTELAVRPIEEGAYGEKVGGPGCVRYSHPCTLCMVSLPIVYPPPLRPVRPKRKRGGRAWPWWLEGIHGHPTFILPCGHEFHRFCLRDHERLRARGAEGGRSCPYCHQDPLGNPQTGDQQCDFLTGSLCSCATTWKTTVGGPQRTAPRAACRWTWICDGWQCAAKNP